jgi:hypothetical protein
MLTLYEPDTLKLVVKGTTCPFHEQHPGVPYAGCGCSVSVTHERRSPEEVAAIRRKRLRDEEDRILAQADAIRLRRAAAPDDTAGG